MIREFGRIAIGVACATLGAATAWAGANVTNGAELKWVDAGIPGVQTAVVAGDMATTPSRFYLKYKAGFVAPLHHHSPNHYGSTVAGNLVLIVDGKEHALVPGSYFSLTDKQPHAARCEGTVDCVMYLEATGPWDVVPEAAKP